MSSLLDLLKNRIISEGIGVVILCVVSAVLWEDLKKHEALKLEELNNIRAEVKQIKTEYMLYLKEDRKQMIKVVEENNLLLSKIK